MMRIVIDIPEYMYEELIEKEYHSTVDSLILDGTPLPKGHGRLIDADALEKRMLDREVELNDDKALWESSAVSVALDMFAPTIIEVDKENSYGKYRVSY